jgi:hypothetical protein
MRRTSAGALVKDFDPTPEKELYQALQTIVNEVHSEDPRFLEKRALSLKEEFPIGSKVFFLGEHGYGVAAQVTELERNCLTVMLAVRNSSRIFNNPDYCNSSTLLMPWKIQNLPLLSRSERMNITSLPMKLLGILEFPRWFYPGSPQVS